MAALDRPWAMSSSTSHSRGVSCPVCGAGRPCPRPVTQKAPTPLGMDALCLSGNERSYLARAVRAGAFLAGVLLLARCAGAVFAGEDLAGAVFAGAVFLATVVLLG